MPEKPFFVLLGEDNDDDAFILNRKLANKGIRSRVRCFKNGQNVIDYLSFSLKDPTFPRPDLVLLDINMPQKDGFQVLEWIVDQEPLHALPVAFLTHSTNPRDQERATRLRPVRFYRKGEDLPAVIELIQSLDCKVCGWI